jgi:Contractile injection system tube protein
MERIAFIIEATGERISCMLNPEHIVHRRIAGLAPRRSGSGVVTGPARSDSPLLHTGGGRTELDLELLFDVDLVPKPVVPVAPVAVPTAAAAEGAEGAATPPASPPRPPAPPRRDVRDYTRPLWNLAENTGGEQRRVPEVRLVLGKAWNMLAVVESLAERFERFDASGTPGRSWLRMRLVRVPDPNPPAPPEASASTPIPDAAAAAGAARAPDTVHVVIGAGPPAEGEPPTGGETLPELAARYFGGRSALWRWIAEVNLLDDDVVWPEPGRELLIPPPPEALGIGEGR